MSRALLLMPITSYRADDFMRAARSLDVAVVIGTDRRQALEEEAPGGTLALDFLRPEVAVGEIVRFAESSPLDAVIGVDDETVLVGTMAAEALGLPCNPPEAIRASRDKFLTRERLSAAGLRTPPFRLVDLDEPPERVAGEVDYPCVLKPLFLSASRGVLRADDPSSFLAAFRRLASLLRRPDVERRGRERARHLLVEGFVPGREVALEGLLEVGSLRALALFDKPDPLEGPTFEETIYVTPSRLPADLQAAVVEEAGRGCHALGLREGPVHVELRLNGREPWLLEIAARSIGGLCSRTLRFGADVSLEELILRHALGRDTSGLGLDRAASGVMMIPVPAAGTLRRVRGLDGARTVDGVEDVVLTMHRGDEVVPLPEGHRYLGFIFARGDGPAEVERALRRAHDRLQFVIEPSAG